MGTNIPDDKTEAALGILRLQNLASRRRLCGNNTGAEGSRLLDRRIGNCQFCD